MGDKLLEDGNSSENWLKLCKYLELFDMSDFEKEKSRKAFQFIGKEFGEDFLEEFINWTHPLHQNYVEFGIEGILWFEKAIKELKDHKNYLSLLNRLKNKEDFYEGLSVLEIAYKFSKIGYKVEIDPSIRISGRIKKPDLKIIDENEEESFIEISILGISSAQKKASQTSSQILEILNNFNIIYAVNIHQNPDDIQLEKIRTNAEKVEKNDTFKALSIENVIDVGMATETHREILRKWAFKNNIEINEISGVLLNTLLKKEIKRAENKIEKKIKQLPYDSRTMIIIKVESLLFHIYSTEKIFCELEKKMNKYPNLSLENFYKPYVFSNLCFEFIFFWSL